jgi:hypothetical protein
MKAWKLKLLGFCFETDSPVHGELESEVVNISNMALINFKMQIRRLPPTARI